MKCMIDDWSWWKMTEWQWCSVCSHCRGSGWGSESHFDKAEHKALHFVSNPKHGQWPADAEKSLSSVWVVSTAFPLSAVSLTFPPPGWYLMLSMEPILERTFFRSGVGALMEREFLGARGTGGFFSSGVCLGTGGLVMTRRRCVASPLVEAAGVAGVVVEMGRRAAGGRRYVYAHFFSRTFQLDTF